MTKSSTAALILVLISAAAAGLVAGKDVIELEPGASWGFEGFYPPETDTTGRPFLWSRERCLIHFRGIDRRDGIRLEIEIRGWRPPGTDAPTLDVEIDGETIWRQPLPPPSQWQTLTPGVGPAEGDHLDLVMRTDGFRPSDTVPGSQDQRFLGLQLRRVSIETKTSSLAWVGLATGAALLLWLLLGALGAPVSIRAPWSWAVVLATLWVSLEWSRPYVLDALPEGTGPLLRSLLLALILTPLFLSRRTRFHRVSSGIALAGCIFTVYAPALRNGFFWDDFYFLGVRNLGEWFSSFYGSWMLTEIGNDYYRPLVITWFQVDRLLYGLRPAGYHLTNLLLHVLNSILVARFLSYELRRRWALAGAVVFALHPMAATGMGWISQRTDVLCATFYLVALLGTHAYLENQRKRDSVLPAFGYAAAIASKEMAITFPAIALGYSALRGRLHRARPLLVTLCAVGAIYVIGWLVLFHGKLQGANIIAHASGASLLDYWHSLLRLGALTIAPIYYPSYDFDFLSAESLTYLYGGALAFFALGVLLLRRGRPAERLLFKLALLWLPVTVLPLFNIRYPDFIRLGYLPAVAAGFVAAAAMSFLSRQRYGKPLAVGILLGWLWWVTPIDQQIVADWSHKGRIGELINRQRRADRAWQAALDPKALAVFQHQLREATQEKDHVRSLLTPQP